MMTVETGNEFFSERRIAKIATAMSATRMSERLFVK